MAAHGGLITRADLAAYSVRVGSPLTGTYRGLDLAFAPGADRRITALEIPEHPRAVPEDGGRLALRRAGLNLRALAVRRALRRSLPAPGDPSVVQAPWDRLASKEYAPRGSPRACVVARERGEPPGRERRPRRVRGGWDCTTHISVVDRHRNMVSLTHTAVSLFRSMVVVPAPASSEQRG